MSEEQRQDVYDRSIEGWHLDKRVPVALIITVFLAVMTGVYAYSRLEGTVENHETRLGHLEERMAGNDRFSQQVLSKVERLDATLTSELAAIKAVLENLRRDLRERR